MFPIYFKDNICVKCGASNSLRILDANDNIILDKDKKDIRSSVCQSCNTEYLLEWENGTFYPIDKSNNIIKFIQNFNN